MRNIVLRRTQRINNSPHGICVLLNMLADGFMVEQLVQASSLHLGRKRYKDFVIRHRSVQNLEKIEDLVDGLEGLRDSAHVVVCLIAAVVFEVFVGSDIDIEPVVPRLHKLCRNRGRVLLNMMENMFHGIRVVFLELDDRDIFLLNPEVSLAMVESHRPGADTYSKLTSYAACHLEVFVVSVEHDFVDANLAAIAELDLQIRVVGIVEPSNDYQRVYRGRQGAHTGRSPWRRLPLVRKVLCLSYDLNVRVSDECLRVFVGVKLKRQLTWRGTSTWLGLACDFGVA